MSSSTPITMYLGMKIYIYIYKANMSGFLLWRFSQHYTTKCTITLNCHSNLILWALSCRYLDTLLKVSKTTYHSNYSYMIASRCKCSDLIASFCTAARIWTASISQPIYVTLEPNRFGTCKYKIRRSQKIIAP